MNRIFFLISIHDFIPDASFTDQLHSLAAGFRLDASTISLLILFPLLLSTFYFIFQKNIFIKFCNGFTILLIMIYNMISFGELCVYSELKEKLNVQLVLHFQHPSEVFQTASWTLTILFFSLTILLSAFYIFLYLKKFSLRPEISFSRATKARRVLLGSSFALFAFGLLVLLFRGGFQINPIREGDACFSRNTMMNDAAINPFRNFVDDVYEYQRHFTINPFKRMKDKIADDIMKEIFSVSKDTTEIFLTITRPNIVFIVLESWSAYTVKSFGGDNYAPFIDSISHEGIYFTNFFPAGYVSDQGITAVFSGYPCTARLAIINQDSKSGSLPCITNDLKEVGYTSGFFYGGELSYGNIKSYLYKKSFDAIKEGNDFPSSVPRGALGIADSYMADVFSEEISKAAQPFVYCWFTLSSHSPFDFPAEKKQMAVGKINDYANSISYTDSSLKIFFDKAKKQSWYKNTLFVVVADHSHDCQKNFYMEDKEFHRIPFLFFGDVIKPEYRGKKIEHVFSQADIAPTILKQMNLATTNYQWGKNMFNPFTHSFAFFTYYYGGGFITDSCYVSFNVGDEFLLNKIGPDTALLGFYGRAYQQAVYNDFMKR